MIPQTPRHDFLRALHEQLRPANYLEIGVQTGRSLAQAVPPTFGWAVDPYPQISVPISIPHLIFKRTSDDFFAELDVHHRDDVYDLAFIDGMHLADYALRDFINVERHARPDGMTVAVLDDVLPYTPEIAGRTPLPGDWTGDVWRVCEVLATERPDLHTILVDVDPTGVLIVFGLKPDNRVLADRYPDIERTLRTEDPPVIRKYIDRSTTVQPHVALATLADAISHHLGG